MFSWIFKPFLKVKELIARNDNNGKFVVPLIGLLVGITGYIFVSPQIIWEVRQFFPFTVQQAKNNFLNNLAIFLNMFFSSLLVVSIYDIFKSLASVLHEYTRSTIMLRFFGKNDSRTQFKIILPKLVGRSHPDDMGEKLAIDEAKQNKNVESSLKSHANRYENLKAGNSNRNWIAVKQNFVAGQHYAAVEDIIAAGALLRMLSKSMKRDPHIIMDDEKGYETLPLNNNEVIFCIGLYSHNVSKLINLTAGNNLFWMYPEARIGGAIAVSKGPLPHDDPDNDDTDNPDKWFVRAGEGGAALIVRKRLSKTLTAFIIGGINANDTQRAAEYFEYNWQDISKLHHSSVGTKVPVLDRDFALMLETSKEVSGKDLKPVRIAVLTESLLTG